MKINFVKAQAGVLIPIDDAEAAKLDKIGVGEIVEAEIKDNTRTTKQNSCLHKYLAVMAQKMAKSGLDMKEVITVPIIPTLENVKHEMFKPMMTKVYPDITSTTKLTTVQIQVLYEAFNAAMAERLGISGQWPDRFTGGEV